MDNKEWKKHKQGSLKTGVIADQVKATGTSRPRLILSITTLHPCFEPFVALEVVS